MNIKMTKTKPTEYGANLSKDSVSFCFAGKDGADYAVKLYDFDTKKCVYETPLSKEFAFGNLYSFSLKGINFEGLCYRFSENGKEFVDPYAKKLSGLEVFGKKVNSKDIYGVLVNDEVNPSGFEKDDRLMTPFSDTILYLMHLRGFTMNEEALLEKRGTFNGAVKFIKELSKLGITAVELMPVYEFIEKPSEGKNDVSSYRLKNNDRPVNYWGFTDSFHFAIKRSFCETDETSYEFKNFVLSLHKAGIECIMQMYFNGDYAPGYILDALHFYAINYHVDGFNLLGSNIPYELIVNDPILKGCKLIMTNSDFVNKTKYPYYRNVAVYDNEFYNRSRKFLKGDDDEVGFMSYALRDNSDFFAPIHNITSYYGFSLWDLVSYNRKHNEANLEDNSDGTDSNYSWNCGEEGESAKRNVNKLRWRQARNAMLLTLLGQAIPEIKGGDEWLNTQAGNNNAYCQDNAFGWTVREKAAYKNKFYKFCSNLCAFRKRHVILHQPHALKLYDYLSCKVPDVSFHSDNAWKLDQSSDSRSFAMLYYGDYSKQYTHKKEDSLYLAFNMYWECANFALPDIPGNGKWKLLYSTDGSTDESFDEESALEVKDSLVTLAGRSISIFIKKA